ncbi:thioredoxin domain-containing protein 15 [Cylas formicarius]|uniref:thioredoxin domain-containing protein 15 n=1 Tax=Cylas formicarius TaxID=197179 RepID=UPI0029587C27|nr:thioredoxin domain-containing protein 15 [Cylas formicarius]
MMLINFVGLFLLGVHGTDVLPEPERIMESEANTVHNVKPADIFSPNSTVPSANTTTTNNTNKVVNCQTGLNGSAVQLVNDTELIKLLVPDPKLSSDRDAWAPCIAVLFYSKNCPFSSMAAPHFNALPRAFPDVRMVAINAMRYHLFNTQNGIVGVPTLLLFHNGKSVGRYNSSEYTLDSFSKYITLHTGIEPITNVAVTSADFSGPVVSSPSKESDMFCLLSWLFIITCSGYYFTKSQWWIWIVETIQRNWRDSEVHAQQHEHED